MSTRSTVLLCGASGFIGRHIRKALLSGGHQVICGRSGQSGTASPGEAGMPMDFSRDVDAATWLPRLAGIDAVVNAVGVLRDARTRPMQAIHQDAPLALFEACAQAGVRRVLHVSALGVDGNPTRYAQTKLAAETHLLGLNAQGRLDAVVLRPSIVFGTGGDSARLFMALARSPALLLPQAVMRARVQPVAVQDLAQAAARLLNEASSVMGMLACVGPTPLTLAAFIASLREQMGLPPARLAVLPDVLTRLSARIGDHIPLVPWCSETLALLAQDNTAPAQLFQAVLGHEPTPASKFLRMAWQ